MRYFLFRTLQENLPHQSQPTEISAAEKVFGKLASSLRLRILLILKEHGRLPQHEITSLLPTSGKAFTQSSVSIALSALENAKLVICEKEKTEKFYSICKETFEKYARFLSGMAT